LSIVDDFVKWMNKNPELQMEKNGLIFQRNYGEVDSSTITYMVFNSLADIYIKEVYEKIHGELIQKNYIRNI